MACLARARCRVILPFHQKTLTEENGQEKILAVDASHMRLVKQHVPYTQESTSAKQHTKTIRKLRVESLWPIQRFMRGPPPEVFAVPEEKDVALGPRATLNTGTVDWVAMIGIGVGVRPPDDTLGRSMYSPTEVLLGVAKGTSIDAAAAEQAAWPPCAFGTRTGVCSRIAVAAGRVSAGVGAATGIVEAPTF